MGHPLGGSTGGSTGGFAMMCVESPVEKDLEQWSAHHTEQPNLEVGLKEKNLEVHSEARLEQSLSLQDCINSEIQLHVAGDQSHTPENESHTNDI